MTNPLRARLAHALDRRFALLGDRLDAAADVAARTREELAEARVQIAEVHATVDRLELALAGLAQQAGVFADEARTAVAGAHGRVDDLLRVVLADDAGNRRRLEALRSGPDYARPFEDPRPLVSVCIPTRADRADLLVERAVPSALAQSHDHLEIVIVGDGFDPRSHPSIAALRDPRVRFGYVTHRMRGTRPDGQWLTGATLSRQEGHRLARGLWITDLDDDDALRPDAVELLLTRAREARAEVTSGLLEQHHPDPADSHVIAGFPADLIPDWSGLPGGWRGRACTAALWHHDLRSFVRLHAAELLGVPGDLFLTIRMARAGVRFALLDEVVYDYWPGTLWDPGDGRRPS